MPELALFEGGVRNRGYLPEVKLLSRIHRELRLVHQANSQSAIAVLYRASPQRGSVRTGGRSSLGPEAYIEESIRTPGAFVVPEFPANVMPWFARFGATEVRDLIEQLKTLK